jgi:tetratricopeptide (TPR) repeat protein
VQEIAALRQEAYYLAESGNYKEASDACNTAASLVTALGLDTSSALYRGIVMVQADIYLSRTEYANARRINEPLATARNTRGEPLRIKAYAMYNIAVIDISTGAKDHSAILKDIAAAKRIFLNLADRYGANFCDIASTEVYFLEGDYEKTSKICLDILAVPELSGDARSTCFQRLGDIAYAQKNLFSALHHYILKLVICHKHEDMRGRTDALRRIGDIFLAHGEVDTALDSWAAALGGFKSMDIHRGRAECLLRIGDVYMTRGQDQRAREQWRDARTFFELCSQTRQVEQCDERLL